MKRIKDPVCYEDGSSEWECLTCGEKILLFEKDHVCIEVGENHDLLGIHCAKCAKTFDDVADYE